MADDTHALQELSDSSDTSQPHLILHYVYLPDEAAASSVATELQRKGFQVQQRLGADGVNWLVLARHFAVPSEARLASVRNTLESLASRFAGEYDGWEAEVRNSP